MIQELLALSVTELLFAILVVFIAYAIKGLSGFGSGLIAVPLLALLLPVQLIVPVLGLLSYSGTIYQSYSLRDSVRWAELWPLLPFSLAGIVIALWLLVSLDSSVLALVLGIIVSTYALYTLLPDRILSGGRWWAVPAGGLAGLVGALFGTGGPFYVIYLRLRQLDKTGFRATIAMIFLADGAFRISGYAVTGLYDSRVLMLVLVLYPVLFMGMYAGHHLHLRISQQLFNRLISLLLLLSGIVLVIKSALILWK